MTDPRDISRRASELAISNPFPVVAENLFLGFFRVLGLVLGRSWYYGSKIVYLIFLAFADGYVDGARAVKAAKPVQHIAPAVAPPPPLVEDERITDHMTPFGVPFGPNVHAWSEPASG